MVPLTPPTTTSYQLIVEEELAKFERRERDLMARERAERAEPLGLPLGLPRRKRLSQTKDSIP
jgi:hypothetical protein